MLVGISISKPWASERGVTLLEILVALGIISIVGLIGVVNHNRIGDSFHRHNSRAQLEYDLRRARQDTMGEGARGIITVDASGTSYTFGFDYPPYSSPATIERQVYVRDLPDGMHLSTNKTIIFDGRGQSIDSTGTLTTVSMTLTLTGSPNITGTLYPIGYVDF